MMSLQTAAALHRALPHTTVTGFEDGSRMIQREGYHAPHEPRGDHSPLLQAAIRRLDEVCVLNGEPDATGDRLIELLIDVEKSARPIQEAVSDWLDEVGPPKQEEFDVVDCDENTDWMANRW